MDTTIKRLPYLPIVLKTSEIVAEDTDGVVHEAYCLNRKDLSFFAGERQVEVLPEQEEFILLRWRETSWRGGEGRSGGDEVPRIKGGG